MKTSKAAGPTGITAELLQAAEQSIISAVTILVNCIIRDGKIPSEWDLAYIVNCYKGKGDALQRTNYRGLKLLDQVLKVTERIVEGVIRKQVDMQFGFIPGRGTTDAIFIVRQMHEKHLKRRKELYFTFVDLEIAFDRNVPRMFPGMCCGGL